MLSIFKVLPEGGTKKADSLPAPKGCLQFANQLYLVVIHLHYVLQTLVPQVRPTSLSPTMEMRRLELLTSAVQRRRSPN